MWIHFKCVVFVLTFIAAIAVTLFLLLKSHRVYQVTAREIAGLVIYLLVIIWLVIAMVQ